MDGKWLEKDESASGSSDGSSWMDDGTGGGAGLLEAARRAFVLAVDSEAGLVEMGGGERCLGGGSDAEWPCEMNGGWEEEGGGSG